MKMILTAYIAMDENQNGIELKMFTVNQINDICDVLQLRNMYYDSIKQLEERDCFSSCITPRNLSFYLIPVMIFMIIISLDMIHLFLY